MSWAVWTLALYISAVGQSEPLQPAVIENEALSALRSITSGDFDLVWTTELGEHEPQSPSVKCRVYFSGNKARFDTRGPSPGHIVNGERLAIVSNDGDTVERLVIDGDKILSYSPDEYADGTRCAVAIYSVEKSGFPLFRFYDPRLIGCSPVGFGHLHSQTYDSFLARPGRLDITAQSELLSGTPAAKLEWKRPEGMVQRAWIAREKGSRLIRAETDGVFRGAPLFDRLESDVTKDEKSGVWFPKRVEFTRTVDGELKKREILEIRNARFNHNLNESVFMLEGLDIRPGAEIYDDTTDGPQIRRIWDGKAIVDGGVRRTLRTLATKDDFRWLPVIVGVNATLVGILLLVLYLRRRRKDTKSV